MKVYLKSRGHYQQQGYQWRKVNKQGCGWEAEEHFNDFLKETIAWVDNDYFSVAIGGCKKKLLLYVTGLESKRKDYRTRPIMNSVVWESENNDDYKTICRIAALALQGNLANKIEAAIKEEKNTDAHVGFEVQSEKLTSEEWLRVVDEDGKNEVKVKKLEIYNNYIASDTQEHRQQIADELKQIADKLEQSHLKFPEKDRILVVVTTGITEEQFRKKEVWRGISDLVKTEQQGWKEIHGGLEQEFFVHNPVNHQIAAAGIAVVLISLATIYQLASNGILPTLLTSLRESFSLTATLPEQTIQLNALSPIALKAPILFRGNYNPQETPNIYLIVDEKHTIFDSKKSPKDLNSQEGTWQFAYKGFTQAGMRQISLKGKAKNGKVIELNSISITVEEKNR